MTSPGGVGVAQPVGIDSTTTAAATTSVEPRGAVGMRTGRDIFRDIARRETGSGARGGPTDRGRRPGPHVGHPSFMRGLRLMQTLEKHGGCVPPTNMRPLRSVTRLH